MMLDELTMWVATAASLITFFAAYRVLRDNLKFGSPALMAFVVAGLAFLGLTRAHGQGNGLITFILIPYAALALVLLLLILLLCLWRRLSAVNRLGSNFRRQLKELQHPKWQEDEPTKASQFPDRQQPISEDQQPGRQPTRRQRPTDQNQGSGWTQNPMQQDDS